MVITVLAAFGLARMGFWGSHDAGDRGVPDLPDPASLLFIPLFQIFGALGLINNFWCAGAAAIRRWPCRSAPGS